MFFFVVARSAMSFIFVHVPPMVVGRRFAVAYVCVPTNVVAPTHCKDFEHPDCTEPRTCCNWLGVRNLFAVLVYVTPNYAMAAMMI